MNENFSGNYVTINKPMRDHFRLHTHENHEIYIFFEGDTDYIIEGTTYSLEPNDMILICGGEMHRAYHKSQKKYSRMVFDIEDEFFDENECPEYRSIFYNREMGTKNKIPAEIVKNSGLLDAIKRWKKYTDNGNKKNLPVSRSILIEILHILNNLDTLYDENEGNNLIQDVILYINRNFTSKITLEDLEDEFFVSRFHLCRTFKKSTGHTIISYINSKRITKVKELYKNGISINKACIEAGFSSYSSFYKAYLKEFGVIPKEGLN